MFAITLPNALQWLQFIKKRVIFYTPLLIFQGKVTVNCGTKKKRLFRVHLPLPLNQYSWLIIMPSLWLSSRIGFIKTAFKPALSLQVHFLGMDLCDRLLNFGTFAVFMENSSWNEGALLLFRIPNYSRGSGFGAGGLHLTDLTIRCHLVCLAFQLRNHYCLITKVNVNQKS